MDDLFDTDDMAMEEVAILMNPIPDYILDLFPLCQFRRFRGS